MADYSLDNEPPDIKCPDDIRLPADSRDYLTQVPNLRPPRVRDVSKVISIVRTPAQLVQKFPLGGHRIAYRVRDDWGNEAQCHFNITVSNAHRDHTRLHAIT